MLYNRQTKVVLQNSKIINNIEKSCKHDRFVVFTGLFYILGNLSNYGCLALSQTPILYQETKDKNR